MNITKRSPLKLCISIVKRIFTISIIVAVVRKFVLLIPLIYIMPHMISDSTTGVYMAEPIADITAVIFTSVLFTFQFKKALAEIQN